MSAALKEDLELRSAGKKLWWRSTFGVIEIKESLHRKGSELVRRFSERAQVSCRGMSMPLQRVITDFGADEPFARVNDKLREHYGFEVPVSCIRAVTLRHGEAMLGNVKLSCEWPQHEGVRQVIAQSDGSMVPVVSVDPESADKRKGKALNWREIRLCVARRHKSLEVQYGGNFSGGVEETGRQLNDCVSRAGLGRGTAVHACSRCRLDLQSGRREVWQQRKFSGGFHASESIPVGRGREFLRRCTGVAEAAAGEIESQPGGAGIGSVDAASGGARGDRRGSAGTQSVSLSAQPFGSGGLPRCDGQGIADWVRGGRKRTSLRNSSPAQASGGLVESRQHRQHAGTSITSRKPKLELLLGRYCPTSCLKNFQESTHHF